MSYIVFESRQEGDSWIVTARTQMRIVNFGGEWFLELRSPDTGQSITRLKVDVFSLLLKQALEHSGRGESAQDQVG